MPDEFHIFQPQLLRETFQPANYPKEEIFIMMFKEIGYQHLLRKPNV
ncbi:MAG: hypothetical protein WBA41_16040 [Rivularia sp. (in: cyanobacteria)]